MPETPIAEPRNRIPILAFLAANAISLIGNQLTAIAVPWYVYETTESAIYTGLVAFATVVPTVLAAFFGGALVDRLGNKRMSVMADLVSCITVAAIPLLESTAGLNIGVLIALAFIGAAFDAPGAAARLALMPTVAAIAGIRLERANGYNQAIVSFSVLIGPAIAGVLIALLDPLNVLWIDAASFAISAALIGGFVRGRTSVIDTRSSYWEELQEGFQFVRRDTLIVSLIVVAAICNFVGAPLVAVVLPVFGQQVLESAEQLGLVLAGSGLGAIAGALSCAALTMRFPRHRLLVGLFVLTSAPIAILAVEPVLAVAILAMALSGFGAGAINPLLTTVLQDRVPVDLRGRVFGVVIACTLIAAPLGMLVAGFAIQAIGVDAVVLLTSLILLVGTAVFAYLPAMRELDEVATQAEQGG